MNFSFFVKVQDDFGVDLIHPPDISPHLFPLEGLSNILNPSVSQSLHSPWIHHYVLVEIMCNQGFCDHCDFQVTKILLNLWIK